MQYKVNDTQAETIPGNESIDTNTVYLSRTAEDNNCEVGKFVFEGTDAETQAVGIKEGATEENILGVVKRCPFQSGYQNGGKILKGNNLTIINKGTVAVKTSTEAKVGDDVFIDNKTGEILTKPIPKLSVEQYEVIQPNFFKKIIYSEDKNIFVGIGIDIIAYSEDGKTFNNVEPFEEMSYYDIIYANGLFVVLCEERKTSNFAIKWSEDGKTFNNCTIPDPNLYFYNSITYGKDIFVAIGNSKALWSADGKTFQYGNNHVTAAGNVIYYANNIFVTVGIGDVSWSEDGKTFTKGTLQRSGIYNKIYYAHNTFILIGLTYLSYSTDGKNFKTSNAPSKFYNDITYANGVFVVVGNYFMGYSTDCINFTECTEYPTGKFNAIIYANDNFIAVGENIAAYSRDGISFSETELIGDYRALANGDGIVIAVGENTAAYTSNGTNYTNINLSEKENFYCITYSDIFKNKFVAGGLNTISYSDTKYNLDFTEGTINLPVNGYNTLLCDNNNCVALGNNVYCYLNNYYEEKFFEYHIMYGNYISAAYGNNITVAAGDKGLMWSDFQNNFTNCESPEGNYNSVTYDNNLFVAVGENIAAWSEDGETFTEGTIPEGNYTSITYGNGLFVAIGEDIAAWSEDGKTFTKGSNNGKTKYVIYANNIFVSVGDIYITVSYDGKDFSTTSFVGDTNFNSVAFGNGVFVVIGDVYIQYSETGTDFKTIPFFEGKGRCKAITYGDGLFIVVGSNGLIAYSDSGKSFTKVIDESIKNINFVDVKYYNGNFIAVGENNLKAVFSIKKESNNYLNTGFKVLTNGEPDETIKIYKQ